MAKIQFLPSRKNLSAPAGTELLEALRQVGIEIESPCGGKGTCGKCLVRITRGEVDFDNIASLTPEALAEGYVQACKSRLTDSDVDIEIDESRESKEGKFIEEDETHMVHRELLPSRRQLDPFVQKLLLTVPPPAPADGLGDVDRLVRAIKAKTDYRQITVTLRVMRKLAAALRANVGLVSVTLQRCNDSVEVIAVDPGNRTFKHYGIAVDLGTTTVVVQIVDLKQARIVATRSDYNDQIACGNDIISRINYAQKPGCLEELRNRALSTINKLLKSAASGHQIDMNDITCAAVSGNTTMTHLLLGLNPEHIRLDPYTPTVLAVDALTASEVGIDINKDARIHFSPNVGSYVGGDITSGLLTTHLATDREGLCLFIDIGTNGEIVVGNNEFLMGCACSAGPAFEGGGVECGMRAAKGAIEKVDVDPETGSSSYTTIGNAPPRGICGSGMIDLIANLFLNGWIDPAGKLCRDRESSAVSVAGRRAVYQIASAKESATGKEVTIDEVDIENIIRAKAAIYSACSLLLKEIDTDFKELENIYIAGGFGRSIDLDKAIVLGLLADIPREKFRFIGNASLIGSYMAVVSRKLDRRRHDLADRMTYIDLSTNPSYMDQYTAALFLPHTDPAGFPSVKEALAKTRR